jgi:hypothetical protein
MNGRWGKGSLMKLFSTRFPLEAHKTFSPKLSEFIIINVEGFVLCDGYDTHNYTIAFCKQCYAERFYLAASSSIIIVNSAIWWEEKRNQSIESLSSNA